MYHSTLGSRVLKKERRSGPFGRPAIRFLVKAEKRGVVVTEAGSYLRPMDSCITQLKAQGPSRTCNESKEEEEEIGPFRPACHVVKLSGFGFRVSGFRFRVSGFGFRVSGFRFQVSGFRASSFRAAGSGFGV